ncbi:MAG: cysteine hydrolase [Anaerolineales bacterium]|nr:cysteine hydrolase [Anaerolineales bacterium]
MPRHTALLVIDMQNDFCHPGGLAARVGNDVSDIAAMLPRLQQLCAEAQAAKVRVIFVRQTHSEWDDSGPRRALPRYKTFYPCREGSWGAEFWGVRPRPNDYVLTKHRQSAFIGTPLDLVLRSQGIQSLVLTGTNTHVCVDCTARDGFQRDYYVVLTSDCTATGTSQPGRQEAALANHAGRYGWVATSDEIAKVWREVPQPLSSGQR